jgi:tRNA (guanine-N7-)-methyltransferase
LKCFFTENEVSEIWITFPDPQMKKVNKRLTSTRFMKEYSHVLKTGGIIHLKSDSNFLYQYTLAMIQENGLELLAETNDLYNSDLLDDALSIRTFYEQQWLERGINIKYIRLLCPKERKVEWREPEVEIDRDDYRSFGRNARV